MNEEEKKEIQRQKRREYKLKNKEKLAQQRKEYKLKNKEKIKEQSRQYRIKNKERDKKWRQEYGKREEVKKRVNERSRINRAKNIESIRKKDREDYKKNIDKRREQARNWYWTDKGQKYAKKRYDENKEVILEQHQKYKEEHREEQKEYRRKYYYELKPNRSKEYYQANREKIIAKQKYRYDNMTEEQKVKAREGALQRHHKRFKNDIEYRIKSRLRGRIREALYSQNADKLLRTEELLGCKVSFFKQHLESQFKEGMSWENQGFNGWHIDHIRPCASFKLTDPEQQKQCFHYSNMQPLWWYENLSKGAKWDEELEENTSDTEGEI